MFETVIDISAQEHDACQPEPLAVLKTCQVEPNRSRFSRCCHSTVTGNKEDVFCFVHAVSLSLAAVHDSRPPLLPNNPCQLKPSQTKPSQAKWFSDVAAVIKTGSIN